MISEDNLCPGCGLNLPKSAAAHYNGYYNTSPECWGVYTDRWCDSRGGLAVRRSPLAHQA